jgi:hypothetical protein
LTQEELTRNRTEDIEGTIEDSVGTTEDCKEEDIDGQASKTSLRKEMRSEEKTSLDRRKKKLEDTYFEDVPADHLICYSAAAVAMQMLEHSEKDKEYISVFKRGCKSLEELETLMFGDALKFIFQQFSKNELIECYQNFKGIRVHCSNKYFKTHFESEFCCVRDDFTMLRQYTEIINE